MVLPHSKSIRSEHPWIESSKFESTTQAAVLNEIVEQVRVECRQRIKHGGKPVKVVFDLDSTIIDVKPRSLRIIKEFAGSKEALSISKNLCEWSLNLKAHQLSYTLQDSAVANGLTSDQPQVQEYMRALTKYWLPRFFSDAYLYMDHPTPGAQEFVRAVVDAGAVAVYLTGRDEPGMRRGTHSHLAHWGFPLLERDTRLLMKPNFGMDDAEYKDSALRDLRVRADAVALFDNEPANFHVFEKNFPQAKLVFMHSSCSLKEAKSVARIYRIENFLFN
jgi:hypothetical protein